MSLSEKLQKLKSQRQMSIQTISDKSGIPIGTVKRIFSGKTTDPGYATVCCILAAMDTGSETAAELYKDVSTETAGSPPADDSRLIDLYERTIETKNKWIRVLLILCLIFVSIFIFILIWDICNPHIGFFRLSQEIFPHALLYIVNQLHHF